MSVSPPRPAHSRRALVTCFALGALAGGGTVFGVLGGRRPATQGIDHDETRPSDARPGAVPTELRGPPSSPRVAIDGVTAGSGTTIALDLRDYFLERVEPWFHPSPLDAYWKRNIVNWATSGDVARVLDAIDSALAAGAKPVQIERGLRLLDDRAAEARIVAGVRARLPRFAWTPGFAEATALLGDGSNEFWITAIRVLVDAPLDGAGVLVDRTTYALAVTDAERVDRELLPLAAARGWQASFLYAIAIGFARANRTALADAWNARGDAAPKGTSESAEQRAHLDARITNARANLIDDPAASSSWLELGNCLAEVGRKDEAFDAITRSVEIDPIQESALAALIALDPERAAPIVERSLAGTTDDESGLLVTTARLTLGQNREAAEATFRRAIADGEERLDLAELAPEVALTALAPYRRNRHVDAGTRLTAARALLALGRADEAVAELRAAIADGSSEAVTALAKVRPAEALPLIDDQTKQWGEDYVREAARGEALLRLGRKDEARSAFDKVGALSAGMRGPEAVEASEVARIGRVVLDPEHELPKLIAAASERPNDARFLGLLGDVYRRLGKLSDARDAYDRAFRADTTRSVWLVRRNLCK